MSDQPNYALCFVLYVLAHFLGAGALVFVGLWVNVDGKGFGFHEEPLLEFKFHPILMSMSLLFLSGEALMIYRGLRFLPKYFTKFVHAILHSAGVVLGGLGIKTVWDYHTYGRDPSGNLSPTPHAVSILPVHRFMGLVIFAFSLAAVLMGTGERTGLLGGLCADQADLCKAAMYVNLFALCVLGYGACVITIVAVPEWVRLPLPNEVPSTSIVVNNYEHASSKNFTTAWTTGNYRQTYNMQEARETLKL